MKTHRWTVVVNRTHYFGRLRFLVSHFKRHLHCRWDAVAGIGSFSAPCSRAEESISKCEREWCSHKVNLNFTQFIFIQSIFQKCRLRTLTCNKTLTQTDLRKRSNLLTWVMKNYPGSDAAVMAGSRGLMVSSALNYPSLGSAFLCATLSDRVSSWVMNGYWKPIRKA